MKEKALKTLEVLLVELLGTKEDVMRFASRYSACNPSVVKSLLSKCLDMFVVRAITLDLLRLILKRESMIRKLGKMRPY